MRDHFIIATLLAVLAGCDSPEEPAAVLDSPGGDELAATQVEEQTAPLPGQPKTQQTVDDPPAPPRVGYWPCWRGPRGDGISPETNWSYDWPESGPPIVWSTKIGIGYSAVSVVDGRAFTMGYRIGQDVVYCFDSVTGEAIWEHEYPCALFDNLHEGGPGATPTVDGDAVYSLSREGQVFCLDAESGNVRWRKDLATELGTRAPEWGFTSSAYVLGDQLIFDMGPVVALDKATGELQWQSEAYPPGYGTPIAFERSGVTYIAVLNNAGLLVVQAADGSQVAFTEWQTDFATNSTTPLIHDGMIFVSTGYNRGCSLFDLVDGQLQPRYENRKMRNHMNNCVLWEGHLYGFDGNAHRGGALMLVCMEMETGEVKWSKRGYGCGALMASNGKLIILGERGDLAIADASPDGLNELARANVLPGRCWTVPVLADGRIYCRDAEGTLVCVDVRK